MPKKLKVKKAFLGLAVQAAPMSLIGIGADRLLNNSQEARDIAKELGIGGNMLSNYYDKKNNKQTKQETTGEVVAKAKGGMARGNGAAIRGTKFKGVF
jgi:predicted transcriptional regulator